MDKTQTIVPFTPPRAPSPEPQAILRFGDLEIRLGLTYLHHLVTCKGWGDLAGTVEAYREGDRVMADAMHLVERAMWEQIEAERIK